MRQVPHSRIDLRVCSFKTHRPAAPVSASSSAGPGSLFCLDRWFQARPASVNLDSPPVPPKTGSVRSPQPLDRSAREWRIPETKAVFLAFLSFIYPLDAYPAEEQVTNMGLLRDVLRSGLGYQSERVVGRVKRALVDLAPTRPIGVYALASRYSLHDLAVIASRYALRVPDNEWPEGLKALMGAKGYQAIEGARQERIAAMQEILAGGMTLPQPECPCDHFAALQEIWKPHIQVCKQDVGATSTLHRVIAFDWSAAGCSSCQAIVQEAVSEILQRQREIKETI